MFVADAPGLDVLNTLATPGVTTFEWLGDGQALLAWLEQARLLPASVARTMRTDVPAARLNVVAAEARHLREWFRAFVLAHKGAPVGPRSLTQLDRLNQVLSHDEAYGAIVAAESGVVVDKVRHDQEPAADLQWRWQRRWRTPDALLLPIAQAMAELVCNADFTHVKQCEGQGCTLLFLDATKGHARRWCSMSVCGNRAKQAAHRARTRSAART